MSLSADDYPVVRASEVAPRLVGPLRACDGEMGLVLNNHDHGADAGLVRRGAEASHVAGVDGVVERGTVSGRRSRRVSPAEGHGARSAGRRGLEKGDSPPPGRVAPVLKGC